MTLSRRQSLKATLGLAAAWPFANAVQAADGLARPVPVAPAAAAASRSSTPDGPEEAKAPPLPTLGSRLHLPDLTLLDGRHIPATDWNGQVTVVYWWASWCPFCALQSPDMEKLWRKNQARGLRMIGLTIDKRAEDAVKYLASKGYSFPAAQVTPTVARSLPKPRGLPVTLVRGRDGTLLSADAGQMFPEDIEDLARFL